MPIRTAADADLQQIMAWLKMEHALEGRGFHANAGVIVGLRQGRAHHPSRG